MDHVMNCQLCDAILVSRDDFEYHMTEIHNQDPQSLQQQHPCQRCGETFSTQSDLDSHVLTSHQMQGTVSSVSSSNSQYNNQQIQILQMQNQSLQQQMNDYANQLRQFHNEIGSNQQLINQLTFEKQQLETQIQQNQFERNNFINQIAQQNDQIQQMNAYINDLLAKFSQVNHPQQTQRIQALEAEVQSYQLQMAKLEASSGKEIKQLQAEMMNMMKGISVTTGGTIQQDYACEGCQGVFLSSIDLKNHKNLCQNRIKQCQLCGMTFTTEQQYLLHTSSAHPIEQAE